MTRLAVSFIFCISTAYSLGADFAWATVLGADASSCAAVAADHHGHCYVAGNFSGTLSLGDRALVSAGGSDIFIAKLDHAGQVTWAVSGGGTNEDSVFTMSATPDGTVFLTGSLNEEGTLDESLRAGGSFLAKVTRRGVVDWIRALTNIWPKVSHLDQKRRVWLAGSEYGPLTLNAWNRKGTLVEKVVTDVSGPAPEFLKMDRAGAFYMTERFHNSATFGTNALSGFRSVIVGKVAPDGKSQWADRISFSHFRNTAGLTVSRAGSSAVYGTCDYDFLSVGYFSTFYSPSGESSGVYRHGQYKALHEMDTVTIDRRDQTFQAGYFVSSRVGGTPWWRGAFINGPGFSVVVTNTARWMTHDQVGRISPSAIVSDARGHVYVAGNYTGSAYFGTNRVSATPYYAPRAFVTRLDLKKR